MKEHSFAERYIVYLTIGAGGWITGHFSGQGQGWFGVAISVVGWLMLDRIVE